MGKGIVFLKRLYEQGYCVHQEVLRARVLCSSRGPTERWYCVPQEDLLVRVLCSSRGPMSKGIVFLKRTYERWYCVPQEDL